MTPEQIVDFLNDIFETDPRAIHALICTRVPVNDALRDHPGLPVAVASDKGDWASLGLLGILNGITLLDGANVEALFEPDPKKREPRRAMNKMIGFRCVYPAKE